MKKQIQPPLPNGSLAASFSIDDWKDVEAVKVPWFDSPLWGALIICGALVGWFAWSAFLNTGEQKAPTPETPTPLVPEFEGVNLPTEPVERAEHVVGIPSNNRVHSVPKSPDAGSNPKRPPSDLQGLLTELTQSVRNGRSNNQIKRDLANIGCDEQKVVQHLTKRLHETVAAHQFEGIILAIDDFHNVIVDNPDIRQQFREAITAAGQHLKVSKIGSMDKQVHSLILDYAQLPENVDLLGKLAQARDNLGRKVLGKLYSWNREKAPELAIDMVQEYGIHPRHITEKSSEVVCLFLWEGKLADKEDFANVKIGDSEASLKAFSKAAVSMINSDPNRLVDSLVSFSWSRHRSFNRDSLPEELVQKMDDALVAKAKEYLEGEGRRAGVAKESQRSHKAGAFLELAKQLGGGKTVIAIAELGMGNPSLLEDFVPVRDFLLSFNEPEAYDCIAHAIALHGPGRSNDLRENLGHAIEPALLRRLQVELTSNDSQNEKWVRFERIQNLVEAIGQIGTAESIPVLQKLTKIENRKLKGMVAKTLQKLGAAK